MELTPEGDREPERAPDPGSSIDNRGRPTKLNLVRLRKVIEAVGDGLPLRLAAAAVGVSEQALLGWRRRGLFEAVRISDIGIDINEVVDTAADTWPTEAVWQTVPDEVIPREWPFLIFSLALERARARWMWDLATTVRNAATSDWRAASWLLERGDPAEWGRGDSRLRIAIETAVQASEQRQRATPDPVSAADLELKFQEFVEIDERRRRSAIEGSSRPTDGG